MGLGEALVPQLVVFVLQLQWAFDMLVPVPLAKMRLQERGYNQSSLISWPLSLALGVTHAPHALTRARETRSQVGLTQAGRRENVRGAFEADSRVAQGRRIILVDDVATTGATLSACAETLLAAGASDVCALTVARAHRSGGYTP